MATTLGFRRDAASLSSSLSSSRSRASSSSSLPLALSLSFLPAPPTPHLLPRTLFLALSFAVLNGSATILSLFEHVLDKHVSFAFFVTLVVGHAGNCGGQTVAVLVRQLAHADAERRRGVAHVVLPTWQTVGREVGMSVLSTLLLVLLFAPVAWALSVPDVVVGTVCLSLLLLSAEASLAAGGICLGVARCGWDPAGCASPFLTSLLDVTGILVYFGLAAAVVY